MKIMLNQSFYGTGLTLNVILSHGISDDRSVENEDYWNAVQKQQLFNGSDIKSRHFLAYQASVGSVWLGAHVKRNGGCERVHHKFHLYPTC